ncbi:Alba-like protein C9orf23 [Gossypium arboreum]|uniref:Alba-like protein C9orf23 n=1 Tax=Gossypium arboreum TaxID=29729 RepID=A0A0B0MQ93_GOSAR|nr:Alba-like protein C9orf23 [Gossypium arboreum]
MDRYQRVEKPKAVTPIDENEIRVTSQGRMRNYITYAMTLLQEMGSNQIIFKAMGRAISKTVTTVELLKEADIIAMQKRIVGLHQITSIGSTDITDMWEPLEEGLLPMETTRHVSMITITLSKNELNPSSVGNFRTLKIVFRASSSRYQPPLPADQVKASIKIDHEEGGSPNGRGRGRGGRGRSRSRGNAVVSAEYDDGGWDRNHGYASGRGRGRGHGSQGSGRGGYNGPQVGRLEDGGHNYEALPQGRGRGRGYRGRGRGFRSNGPIQAAV